VTDQPRDDQRTREMPLPGPDPVPGDQGSEQTRPDVPQPFQPPPEPQVPAQRPAEPPAPQPETRETGVENWHRLHYPIGFFLVAYGLTTVVLSLLGWSAHREGIEGYLGEGIAGPALIVVKVAETLLVLLALAGLLRRRDVWFLPGLVGWLSGFGVFCLLDVVKGKLDRLPEHFAFLVLFAALLFLSYALGVKVRVGREAPAPDPETTPEADGRPGGLSRTQEFALAALNRWQRQPDPPPQQHGEPR
jgi:hypothetical protein